MIERGDDDFGIWGKFESLGEIGEELGCGWSDGWLDDEYLSRIEGVFM